MKAFEAGWKQWEFFVSIQGKDPVMKCSTPEEVAKKSPQELLSPAGADWYRTSNERLAWTGNTRPQNAFDISECASGAKAPPVAEAKRLGKVIRGVLETTEDSLYLPRETQTIWAR